MGVIDIPNINKKLTELRHKATGRRTGELCPEQLSDADLEWLFKTVQRLADKTKSLALTAAVEEAKKERGL